MKTFLWAGTILMTGASIYGFIDYKKTSHEKAFTNLYKDESAVTTDQKQTVTEVKKEVASEKTEIKKTDVKTSVVNNQPVKKEMDNKTTEKMTINPVETVKTETISNVTVTPKSPEIKKKKVLSYKLFSRAALDEKYITKELKLDTTENKKQ